MADKINYVQPSEVICLNKLKYSNQSGPPPPCDRKVNLNIQQIEPQLFEISTRTGLLVLSGIEKIDGWALLGSIDCCSCFSGWVSCPVCRNYQLLDVLLSLCEGDTTAS